MELKQIGPPAIYCQEHVLLLVYKWYLGSRWYTSDLNMNSIDISAFVPPRHQGLVSRCRRNVSGHRIRELGACFMSASSANCVPSKCFLYCLKRWKSLDLILPTGLASGYGTATRRIWTTLPTVCAYFHFYTVQEIKTQSQTANYLH